MARHQGGSLGHSSSCSVGYGAQRLQPTALPEAALCEVGDDIAAR